MGIDGQNSEFYLNYLKEIERIKEKKIPGVRVVLVVLSSRGMVYDAESLRQKILQAYPDAAIFFRTTAGQPLGVASPQQVDLAIDLTGPGQRQGFLFARKIRKVARFAVGRNAGLFRKRIYDRVFDEILVAGELPQETLEKERRVQREVLALAGVPMVPAGECTQDQSKTIALELPPLASH